MIVISDGKRGDPQFQANALNGKGVVDFDGNDGLWQNNNAKSMYNHTANGFTMFAVSRYDGTDSERVISSYDNWNWLFAGHGQYHTRIAHFNGWGYQGPNQEQDNNDWHIYEALHGSNDKGSYWLDSVNVATDSTGSHNNNWRPKRMQFGGYRNGRENSQCQIAEFITINRVITEEERPQDRGLSCPEVGAADNMLPLNHPYRTDDPFRPMVTVGGEDATVTFYWGDNNGSNSGAHNQWDSNQVLSGTHGMGVVSHNLTGLTKGQTYYYTAKVTNSGGTAWGPVKTFVPNNTLLNKYSIPNLALWLDASDVDGDGNTDVLVIDSAPVATWVDKSVGQRTVSQGTSTSQPAYKTNAFGNKPGIRFDGTSDFLNVAPVRTSAGPHSVFVMATRPSDNLGDDPGYLVDEAGWNLTAGSGTSSFAAKVFEKHAASGATLMSMKIGKSASSALNDFGGDIAEVLVFDRQLSNTETQQIQGYLAHRWRATDSLVSSHPYKEIPPVFDNSPKLSPKPPRLPGRLGGRILDARRHGRSDRVRGLVRRQRQLHGYRHHADYRVEGQERERQARLRSRR